MFFEIASDYTKTITDYTPYSTCRSASDTGIWGSSDTDYSSDIINLAESYLDYTYPALPASLYMDFGRTGNRVRFETPYFARRHALNALIIGECTEHSGRFMPDIINGIFALCEESDWQLPAHNCRKVNGVSVSLPDLSSCGMDLFVCETGALLAVAYYLLKERFDEISPIINKRILSELEKRVLTPYLTKHFGWVGSKGAHLSNWTPWCTQNVLITALMTGQAQDIKSAVLKKAAQSLDYFFEGYGEDGCCDEGAFYFRSAGLCLFNAIDIMNYCTGGAFNSCFESTKLKNMALYIKNMHIGGENYFNFADCSPVAGRAGAREFLFGKAVRSEELMQFAAQDYAEDTEKTYPTAINLFYRLQAVFMHDEVIEYAKNANSSATNRCRDAEPDCCGNICENVFYESVGVIISKNDFFSLAVKAGHNDDCHNHNDVGSFILYRNGKPVFIDVGIGEYTSQTFSSERYKLWTVQSSYHNLPEINGVMQSAGQEYKATDLKVSLTSEFSNVSMNISSAYPSEASCSLYIRDLTFSSKGDFCLTDRFDTSAEVVLNFMTYEKPVVKNNSYIVIGDSAFEISGITDIEVEAIPINDSRLGVAWKHEIYRMRMKAENKNFSIALRL